MSNILQAESRAAILKRLSTLSPSSNRLWGTMTAQQMLCHVTDQLRMALGEVPAPRRGSFLHRTLIKKLILLGIPAPKGKIKTVPELDQKKSGTQPTTFDGDRDALQHSIEKFITMQESALTPHSMFGTLTKQEWGRLIYIHLQHHFQQFGI